MRILFAGKQHYDPGGIPVSTDQLAHRLSRLGHSVAVLAHAGYDGPPAGPDDDRLAIRTERGRGYDAWSLDLLPPGPGLDRAARRFRPDVIVVNAGGHWWHDWTVPLVRSAPDDVPVVLYVRDPEAVDLLDDLAPHVELVVANAAHHAVSAAAHGVSAVVVPSLVDPDRHAVEPTGEAVVFLNPVPVKGVATAWALAERRPDVPFHFRTTWRLPLRAVDEITERARTLGNVTLLPSTLDLRAPYRHARLLLAPYEDMGRPRVVGEAQLSGIPVLARDDPPLREAVGPGGILVPPDAPLSAWLDGLAALWDDDDAHARFAEAARVHSRRDEMDPERVAAGFLDALRTVVGGPISIRRCPASTRPPVASVIVPARNAADTLGDQLAALAGQSFRGDWEVVVADNGSTDGTRGSALRWQSRLPALTVVDASARRGVAHARNVGLRTARGDLLLICDADDVVAPDWLDRMVRALDDHPIVTGFLDIVAMNRVEQYEWLGDADQRAAPLGYGYLPYARGGNVGMWREVYDELGGFDEQLLRAEDIDFGWRAAYLGLHVHFEPEAVLYHRIRPTARSVFRAAVRGGMAEPGLYRRHRDHGMPRAEWADVRAQYRRLVRRIPDVAAGRADRHQWGHHAGKRVGRIVGSLRNGVTYL